MLKLCDNTWQIEFAKNKTGLKTGAMIFLIPVHVSFYGATFLSSNAICFVVFIYLVCNIATLIYKFQPVFIHHEVGT